jgi:hypothetical protein
MGSCLSCYAVADQEADGRPAAGVPPGGPPVRAQGPRRVETEEQRLARERAIDERLEQVHEPPGPCLNRTVAGPTRPEE